MDIINKALKTARLIGTVKVTVIVANIVASIGYIIAGIAVSQPSYDVDAFGHMDTDGSPLAAPLIIAGLVNGVVGTFVLLALFGFFQYMLATNAELLKREVDRDQWTANQKPTIGTMIHRLGEDL